MRSSGSNALAYGWDTQGTGIAGGEVTITLTEQDGKTHLLQHLVGAISEEMFPLMEQGTNGSSTSSPRSWKADESVTGGSGRRGP